MQNKLKNKAHITAGIGTALAAVLLFLFLWFFLIRIDKEQELLEEGVEIAFAEMDEPDYQLPYEAREGAEGSAAEEGLPQSAPTPAAQAPAADVPSPVVPQEATKPPLTQHTPSPVQKPQEPQEDPEAKAAEEARQKAEAAAKAKAEAEAKAQAEAKAKAQRAGALFGKGNGGAGGTGGAGSTGSSGTGTNPAKGKGSGTSGAGNWKLAGRSIVGNLPQPEKGKYQPGVVVIEIRVNPEGQVVSAKITTGTNISDKATIDAMLQKAREARFSSTTEKQDQIGQITYTILT